MQKLTLILFFTVGVCRGLVFEEINHQFEINEIYLKSQEIVIKLNKGIDAILGLAHAGFISDGELSINLPNINKTFGKPPYNGIFSATSGYFKDPASLHRTGDVQIVKKGDSVSLEVALGLSEFQATFDNYTLDILGIHQSGLLNITVEKNSLKMKITLTYSPACTFKLDYIEFDELSGIKVEITGLGVFQTMFDELSKWLISNFEGNFRKLINMKLFKKLNAIFVKKNICKYFPQ